MLSKKVIVTGSFGVGKTSLFERFINNKFEDKYLTTIGVKVGKKLVNTEKGDLSMMIWDIAGEVAQNKVPTSYFLGTSGIIYVFDVTRPSTYGNLKEDIEYLKNINKLTTIRIVGNKKDLISEEAIESLTKEISLPIDLFTSAKTGENVTKLFQDFAVEMVD